MFFMPVFLISILTFPGVIVHEVAHQLFCKISRVAVFDACYFRFGNMAGYIAHEIPKHPIQHILIGIGPFFVNSLMGAIIALPSAMPVIKFGTGSILDYFLVWLGVSIAMHSFPSVGDAKSIWKAVWNRETSIVIRLVTVPIVGIIYICALGSIVWFDLLYGIAIAMFIPDMIIKLFA